MTRCAENTGERPSDFVIRESGRLYITHMRCGPGKHLHGLILPGGMRGQDFDYLGELVVTQEIARIGARGYQDGWSAGLWIGLSKVLILRRGTCHCWLIICPIAPIINYGTPKQKELIAPILAGDQLICLAITEREY